MHTGNVRMMNGSRELSIEAKFAEKRRATESQLSTVVTSHRLYLGDAREMRELCDERSVHLVITSPPYWNLKEYPHCDGGQLGNYPNYREFLVELARVWKRCFSLLVPGGRLCIVVGDVCLPRKKAGRHRVIPLHADIARDCIEIGFDYLSPIFWHKIANAETEVEGNGAGFLGKPYEPNAVIKNDVEYILILRKPGGYRKPTPVQRALSILERDDHDRWFRQIWNDVPGQIRLQGHPAPFPKEVPIRLISMFSFVGDTVLDPFCGTGTTTAAAMELHRASIGYELEPRYFMIMRNRLEGLFSAGSLEFIDGSAGQLPPIPSSREPECQRRRDL
jgi:site-specific DNA-methyltransferase (adenine-specific)